MWNPEVKGLYENALNVHPLKEVVKGDGTSQFILNAGAEPHTLDPNPPGGYGGPGARLHEVEPNHWILCEPTPDNTDAEPTQPRLNFRRDMQPVG